MTRQSFPVVLVGIFASLFAFGSVASAQNGPQGIGFAQAEEGTWWCTNADSAEAFACARAQCAAESGGQDCYETRWCTPAGWSGLMIVWLPEFHSTHVICGMPGRDAARAALSAICRAAPEFSSCDLMMMIDPDGNALEISETIDPRRDPSESDAVEQDD